MLAMKTPLAGLLQSRRRARGLSQAEIAARLGVARGMVSKWERAEAVPSASPLRDLAALLEVSVEELQTRTRYHLPSGGMQRDAGSARRGVADSNTISPPLRWYAARCWRCPSRSCRLEHDITSPQVVCSAMLEMPVEELQTARGAVRPPRILRGRLRQGRPKRAPYPMGATGEQMRRAGGCADRLYCNVLGGHDPEEGRTALTEFPRDTRRELLTVFHTLWHGGRVVMTSPSRYRCPSMVLDDFECKYGGDQLQPALLWRGDEGGDGPGADEADAPRACQDGPVDHVTDVDVVTGPFGEANLHGWMEQEDESLHVGKAEGPGRAGRAGPASIPGVFQADRLPCSNLEWWCQDRGMRVLDGRTLGQHQHDLQTNHGARPHGGLRSNRSHGGTREHDSTSRGHGFVGQAGVSGQGLAHPRDADGRTWPSTRESGSD